MDFSADDVAKVVLEEFDRLPIKRKPLVRGDGVREWVPLSGIVAQGFTLRRLGADHEADVFHRER
jgi:tRNA-specific adenosine deaminase 1